MDPAITCFSEQFIKQLLIVLFQAVVDCGALDALVICLEEFDPGVKEAAAWALGYIARHNAGQYMKAVPNGVICRANMLG